ncbi:FCD domain-containing protein [Nocardia sp. NPDC052278]|uniref:FCD domain-containing protein n=1 Tax=unclassified Nocardia TaxID=2637762 RepID=UPI0036BF41BB
MLRNLSMRTPGRAEESRREAKQTMAAIRPRDVDRAVDAARHHVRMAKQSALHALRARMGETG